MFCAKNIKKELIFMKKIIFAIIMIFVLTLCGCGGGSGEGAPTPSILPKSEAEAIPEGSISFEIKNESGGDIYEAYIAASETDMFGEDLLKERIIKDGDSMNVHFMPTENVQYYDLKVLREDGQFYTWLNVPAPTIKKINLLISSDEGPLFTTE